MEPRISRMKTYELIMKIDFEFSYRVEAVGFSKGIWLLWQDCVEVEVVINHRQFIHFKVCKNNIFVSWVTAFYASPNPMLRRQF